MTYRYTYRDESGNVKTDYIDAETRQACFSILKGKGISPISLSQSEKSMFTGKRSLQSLHWRSVILSVVFLMAIGTFLIFLPSAKNESVKPEVIHQVEPVKHTGKTPTRSISSVATNQIEQVCSDVKPEKPRGVLPAPSNLSDEIRAIKAASLTNIVEVNTNGRPKQIFTTSTEQVMSFIFNAEVGDMPPPLPTLPRNERARIEEILNTPNPILETDSPDVAEKKKMLEQAKRELKDYMAQGGTPEEFLSFYHQQLKKYHEERKDAQRLVMTMIRDEPEVAGEFMKKVNERLASRGIKAVHIPRPFLERAGIKSD